MSGGQVYTRHTGTLHSWKKPLFMYTGVIVKTNGRYLQRKYKKGTPHPPKSRLTGQRTSRRWGKERCERPPLHLTQPAAKCSGKLPLPSPRVILRQETSMEDIAAPLYQLLEGETTQLLRYIDPKWPSETANKCKQRLRSEEFMVF
jgi:hypothetical protein